MTLPPGCARARDKAAADRIARDCKDDGDDRCRLLQCSNGASISDDDVDLLPDELRRNSAYALGMSFRPAILDRDGATFDPAELT